MAEAGDIGDVLQITMILFEGNFTRTDIETPGGLYQFGGTYAAPLRVGDFVELYDGANKTVTTASAGASVIGRIVETPKGPIPEVGTDGGVWTWSASPGAGARHATVEWYKGKCVRRFLIDVTADPGVEVQVKDRDEVTTGSGTKIGVLMESASSGSTVSVIVY
jgi:hypothetical protein